LISFYQGYTPKTCRQDAATLVASEGFISSHLTDNTGCGSAQNPWIISAMFGQTIDLSIIDFGSELLKKTNTTTSLPVYGHVTDGTEKITIRGGRQRERHLLTSKTNHLSIQVASRSQSDGILGFILHYKSRYSSTTIMLKAFS